MAVASKGAEFVAVNNVMRGGKALGGSGGAVYATSDYTADDLALPLARLPGSSLTAAAVDMVNCTLSLNTANSGGAINANFLSLSMRRAGCIYATFRARSRS